VFVNESTYATSGSSSSAQAKPPAKMKSLKALWGKPSESKSDVAASGSSEDNSGSVGTLKGRVLKVECDLPGTRFTGEGRTIMLELENLFIVACYVPNSGQNLERLSYRTQEW
jgi:exonuclease III